MSARGTKVLSGLPASTAITKGLRVYFDSSNVIQLAGSGTPATGVANDSALSTTLPISVQPFFGDYTVWGVASGVITAGQPAYAAANGKVSGSGTYIEGIAMNTTANDGDGVELRPPTPAEHEYYYTGT